MACASTQPSGINTLRQLCDFYGRDYESELLHSLNVWRREILIIKRGFILRFTNILEDIMFRYEGFIIWHMKTRRQHKFNIRQIQRNFRIMGCLRRLYHRVILKYMRRIYEGLESKNVSARKFHRNIGALRTSLEQAREWITLLGGPSGICSSYENCCRNTVWRNADVPSPFDVHPAWTDWGTYFDEVD